MNPIKHNPANDLVLKCDEPDCSERTILRDDVVFDGNPFCNGWRQYDIYLGRCECWSGSGRWSPNHFHRCPACRVRYELTKVQNPPECWGPDDFSREHAEWLPVELRGLGRAKSDAEVKIIEDAVKARLSARNITPSPP